MVRFTAALILECPQVTTPLGERALIVRGKGIEALESHAAEQADPSSTYHSPKDLLYEVACTFDVLDLSNNAIRRVDGFNFPPLASRPQPSLTAMIPRLSTLILHNNAISRIAHETIQSLAPTLHTFAAHNNQFRDKADLDVFAGLPNLERLSLIGNPVSTQARYRLYVIARCGGVTKLKLLDFNRILDKERRDAALLTLPPLAVSKPSNAARRPRPDFDTPRLIGGTTTTSLTAPMDGKAHRAEPENETASLQPRLTEEEVARRAADIEARLEKAVSEAEIEALNAEYEKLLTLAQ